MLRMELLNQQMPVNSTWNLIDDKLSIQTMQFIQRMGEGDKGMKIVK